MLFRSWRLPREEMRKAVDRQMQAIQEQLKREREAKKSVSNRAIWAKLTEMEQIMSTVPAGLAALTTAVSDLTAAVSAATSVISQAATELAQNEDPQVQNLAAQIEAQVTALKTATEPPAAS